MEKIRGRALNWWQFHHILWRYKILVVAIVLVGAFASVAYTSSLPVRYRSSSNALLDIFSSIASQDSNASVDFSKAHKLLAETSPVVNKGIHLSGLTPEQISKASFEARVEGALIYFSVTDVNPQVAATLANSWAMAFIEEIDSRSKSTGDQLEKSLREQADKYRNELEAANKKMSKMSVDNKLLDPESFKNDPVHQAVSGYEQTIRADEEALTTLDAELKIISNPENDPSIFVQLQHVARDKTFLDRFKLVKDAEFNLADKRVKFKPGAETAEAEEQLKQTRALLEDSRKALIGALKLDRELLVASRDDAKKQYAIKKEELDTKQALMNQHRALTTDIDSIRQNFEYYSNRQREAAASKVINHINIIKWEDAQPSGAPFSPNWRQNITAGLLLSFVLACGLVVLLEQLDDTVRTAADLEPVYGAAVVGSIPECGGQAGDEGYQLVKHEAFSVAADSLRGIHIALEVGRRHRNQTGALVITVTSALPQDGKSFVTSNLGILFAALGRSVLVVDADLRKASLSKALKVSGKRGFLEVVKAGKWTREFTLSGTAPGYSFLPAGYVNDDTNESLSPEQLSALLEQMRRDYDVILFDTPPVLSLPDACVLGQLSDVTLLVTRSRHTRVAQIERAATTLNSAKVKELVLVVNHVDATDALSDATGRAYGYGYGYGYGHGRGYGREERTTARSNERKPVGSPVNGSSADSDDEDA